MVLVAGNRGVNAKLSALRVARRVVAPRKDVVVATLIGSPDHDELTTAIHRDAGRFLIIRGRRVHQEIAAK